MHIHKQTIQLIRLSLYLCVLVSHVHQIVSLLLVPSVEHISEALEGIVDILCLKSANFEEFEADTFCESQTVLGTHSDSVFDVNFVSDDNSHKWAALVVLLDSLQPLSQKVECVRVGNVIDQHNEVSLSEQLESDLLEDVLPSNIDQVKLHTIV